MLTTACKLMVASSSKWQPIALPQTAKFPTFLWQFGRRLFLWHILVFGESAAKHLYVKKKVQDYLAPSQFAAFQQGFNKVCDTRVLGIFRPVELEALVTGEKYFDWVALEKSTQYKDPYTDSHSTIKMFWEVFHALDDDQKREFLVFVAGSDRVPVGGLQNLGLTIVELIPEDAVDNYDDLCLKVHRCNNDRYNRTLELPMHTSKELVKDRLLATLSISLPNGPFHIA
ncbi:probable E3 ubiquitin-protein ligase HERC4 [Strongylocentrotus purpuratus]|uniref:HECT-type E3 ubiquitin transferase n=1 Tax=Strongylocentrotus purpuratus TaxID=7668 RepID=A0A7M7NIQ4_STRPU|nr:probable E3 ubiquitin-protein ligase HERC4 [Strongylocentrotus purpuratus]